MSIALHLSTPVTLQILCGAGLFCVWHVLTAQGYNGVQQARYAQLLDLVARVLTAASLRFCCHVELIPNGAGLSVSNRDIASNMLPYQIWY